MNDMQKKAEQTLRDTVEKYRSIIDNIDDSYFEVDIRGKITFCSPSTSRIVGYTIEELTGVNYRLFTAATSTDKVYRTFLEVYRTGEPARLLDWEVVKKDGTTAYVEASVSLMRDPAGDPVGFRGVVRDITERKRAEQALRESENLYRTIFENTGTASAIVDQDTLIVLANTEFEKISGYTKEELEGKRSWTEFIMAEDLEWMRRFHEARRIDAASVPRAYEFRFRDRSGRIKSCIIYTAMIPETTRSIASLLDITERRHAEEELRKSEEFLRLITENVQDAIRVIDLKTMAYTYANPYARQLFGIPEQDYIGSSMGFNLDEDSQRRLFELLQEELSHDAERNPNRSRLIELQETNRAHGGVIWTENNASFIRDEDGRPTAILSITRDITERKRLEAQLLHAQKMEAIGTLAGGIAHDFNNLLMGIGGYASLMLMGIKSDHPHHEKLQGIEALVKSGADLAKQLLGFARGGQYEAKPTNLNELLEKTASTFGRTKKEVVIHKILAQDLWTVLVDQSQIEQVLLNLYVNAWQAMPSGGDLYLETENTNLEESFTKPLYIVPGKYVELTVTDTGTGMDEKTKLRIFEPFFTTKEMGRGTGMGLASAYGIIKAHGGIVTVDSKEGRGSTFHIYLPVSGKEPEPVKAAHEHIRKGEETILVVDDEKVVVEVTGRMLEALGYRAFKANSGQEAIELYRERREEVALVLLDMIMPQMGGGETFESLKSINPDVKVILCSGYSLNEQAKDIMDRGCRAFIEKPYNMAILSKKIREVLEKE